MLLLLLLLLLRYEVRIEGGIVQMYDHGGFTFIPSDRFFGTTSFKYIAVVSTAATTAAATAAWLCLSCACVCPFVLRI
jgi:hypothetical protein